MNKMILRKKVVPIFFATDDNYFPYLGVALRSLIDNASRKFDYHIYILNSGVSEKNEKIAKGYVESGFKIELVNVSDKMAGVGDDLDTRDYYTKTTYFRFFIQSMFPQYNKALYLDADIIINGDISKLYNMELGDCIVGGIQEQIVGSTQEYRDYSQVVLGLDYKKYFNAGIMVMNLKKFRELDIENRFVAMIQKYHFDTIAQDQDYLNFLVQGKVKYIDLSWNKEPIDDGYTGELNLIHYALFKKPWTYFGMKNEDYFWKYAIKTPYYDMLLAKRENYTEAQRQADAQADINLRQRAIRICKLDHTFYNVLVKNAKQTNAQGENVFDLDSFFFENASLVPNV